MSLAEEQRAYKMFLGDVKGHRMTVIRDDGLYRHVRFGKPNGSSLYRFDLVTWPGHLVITGDFQDYHFARVPDMFEFFRTKQLGEINPSYWSEKLVGRAQTYEGYEFDRFKDSLINHFLWLRDEIPEGRRREVWKAIREEILEGEGVDYSADIAIQTATDFWFPYTKKRRWEGGDGFSFNEVYEWPLKDYDWHFLVSLHAIVWGIHQWDTREHKTELDWSREDHARTRAELANLRAYHNYGRKR